MWKIISKLCDDENIATCDCAGRKTIICMDFCKVTINVLVPYHLIFKVQTFPMDF